MVEALKKMDKKFLIFAGCIIFLPILIIIFLAIMQGCSSKGISHERYEDRMVSAAEKYFKENDSLPDSEFEVDSVKLSKLVDKGYIKSTEKLLNDDTCSGEVSVRKNGSTYESNNGGFFNYIPSLECDKYKTNSLKNLLTEYLTESGPGLYKTSDGYVFKGDSVRNYLRFYGTNFRILSIDNSGIVKIMKEESESSNLYWDTKYNTETSESSGKNIYSDSNILKKLNEYYESKIKSEDQKSKMVANSVCIGKRDIKDYDLDSTKDCSDVINYQPISLINITDFAKASLDAECVSLNSRSCRNYNYLHYLNFSSWTLNGVSNNTYEVYYLENGDLYYQEANRYEFYNLVFYLDSGEIVKSGNGSKDKPYVIE